MIADVLCKVFQSHDDNSPICCDNRYTLWNVVKDTCIYSTVQHAHSLQVCERILLTNGSREFNDILQLGAKVRVQRSIFVM